MKIAILFSDSTRFVSNEIEPANVRTFVEQLVSHVRDTNSENRVNTAKALAASGTAIKYPLSRSCRMAVQLENGREFPLLDLKRRVFVFRGKALTNDLLPAFLEERISAAIGGDKSLLSTAANDASSQLEETLWSEKAARAQKLAEKKTLALNEG